MNTKNYLMGLITKIKYRHAVIGSVLVGIGLGLGSIATLFMLSNNHPTIVVEDKWKTIATVPTTHPDLGHSSLNPDELNHLLQMEGQPGIAGITSTTTTSTTMPPVSSTTQPSLPAPSTTVPTLPPSTLPPSSTTLTSGTTTSVTSPPSTISTTTTQAPTTTTQAAQPATTSSTN